jgi:hypothetical protein
LTSTAKRAARHSPSAGKGARSPSSPSRWQTSSPRFAPTRTRSLLTRLAAHYDDTTIAAILNRQGRLSARGERFTAIIVGGLRRHRGIPAHKPPIDPPDGELLPIGKAAEEFGVAASTIHRWLQAGFIAGEQDTPAPRGGSASTTSYAPCSSKTHHPAMFPSSTRYGSSASPARPCCSV